MLINIKPKVGNAENGFVEQSKVFDVGLSCNFLPYSGSVYFHSQAGHPH